MKYKILVRTKKPCFYKEYPYQREIFGIPITGARQAKQCMDLLKKHSEAFGIEAVTISGDYL